MLQNTIPQQVADFLGNPGGIKGFPIINKKSQKSKSKYQEKNKHDINPRCRVINNQREESCHPARIFQQDLINQEWDQHGDRQQKKGGHNPIEIGTPEIILLCLYLLEECCKRVVVCHFSFHSIQQTMLFHR